MPNFKNIVSHLQSSDWVRPKQRSWAVFINRPDKRNNKRKSAYLGNLSHCHNFLDDADKSLDKVAEGFYENNYKAGRQFSFEVIDNECHWMLHYPNIDRTVTGVIRKGQATGRGVKSHG